jgi:hypothetical protein
MTILNQNIVSNGDIAMLQINSFAETVYGKGNKKIGILCCNRYETTETTHHYTTTVFDEDAKHYHLTHRIVQLTQLKTILEFQKDDNFSYHILNISGRDLVTKKIYEATVSVKSREKEIENVSSIILQSGSRY